jgi:hypothetical protein
MRLSQKIHRDSPKSTGGAGPRFYETVSKGS